jgi:hypothetical protein
VGEERLHRERGKNEGGMQQQFFPRSRKRERDEGDGRGGAGWVGPVERDVERRRTGSGSRQLRGSGGDGRRSVTYEAGEARGEANGWGLATVPQFQYRLKPGKLIHMCSNIF